MLSTRSGTPCWRSWLLSAISAFSSVVLLASCTCSSDNEDAPPAPSEAVSVELSASSLGSEGDSLEAELEALRALDVVGEGANIVAAARTLGQKVLDAKRSDLAGAIGWILIDRGQVPFAQAFLQRSLGLLPAAEHGKDHLYPLAQLRRAASRPIEAASLLERAIDIEPTASSEFVGLSDHYLAAGRYGPARAAVSRGLRKHPNDTLLAVQGAKVALLGEADGPERALAALGPILAADPSLIAARLVRLEALLAAGRLDTGRTEAQLLREEAQEDAWGWIFGSAVAAATGDASSAGEWLARAGELAGDCACTHEERLAIVWAGSAIPGESVPARSRTEVELMVAPAPGDSTTPQSKAPVGD